MQKFRGIVSQIRTVAVTSVQNNQSSVRHHTSLRFGTESLNLNTRNPAPIHLGDDLHVSGFRLGGTVIPFVLKNRSNGYEAGFASWAAIAVTALIGVLLVAGAFRYGNGVFAFLGVFGLALSALFGAWRASELRAMSLDNGTSNSPGDGVPRDH